jgi:MFS family permease
MIIFTQAAPLPTASEPAVDVHHPGDHMALAFLLAGLLTAGMLAVWMAFAIAVLRGVTNSFNQPARQSLISELVPEEDLPNAVALHSATVNLTKIIGPAIGGIPDRL